MFYLTISFLPVSGLGYIVGSQVGSLAQDWHWALRVSLPRNTQMWNMWARVCDPGCCLCSVGPVLCSHSVPSPQVTPGLGLIAVLLLLFVVQEPKRGAIEARPEHHLNQTSWLTDLHALSKK